MRAQCARVSPNGTWAWPSRTRSRSGDASGAQATMARSTDHACTSTICACTFALGLGYTASTKPVHLRFMHRVEHETPGLLPNRGFHVHRAREPNAIHATTACRTLEKENIGLVTHISSM